MSIRTRLVLPPVGAALSVVSRWCPGRTDHLLFGGIGAALFALPRLELDPGFFFSASAAAAFSDGWLMRSDFPRQAPSCCSPSGS